MTDPFIQTINVSGATYGGYIYLSCNPEPAPGYTHAYVVLAGSHAGEIDEALKALDHMLSDGRRVCVRHAAEVISERDFETDKIRHAGVLRLSFCHAPKTVVETEKASDDGPPLKALLGWSAPTA
jgi:hypothetical protein